MTSRAVKTLNFFSICFTFFVDYLCWSIVFPIFAPYFIDVNNRLFPASISVETRTMILGFFLMIFSLGQFLGAPLIGEYGDKHGRRKALLISVSMTVFGLAMSAYCIEIKNLFFLFIGRFITGVFAGSTTICLACTSDLSTDEKEKAKYFGILSMIAGVAFILGAFAGGKLSDRSIYAAFSTSLPLWIAAGFTLANFLFILFFFRETTQFDPKLRFHILESFTNIKIALKTEKIKEIYIVYFLFFTAWTLFFQFIPVLTIEKFSFTNSNIGDLALFMGLCWAVGSGYLNKHLIHRFKTMHVLELCLIGFTSFCFFVVLPKHLYSVLGIIGVCVVSGSIAWPLCVGMISNAAPEKMQGKIIGLSQSVQSLAMAIGPAIGGIAFSYSLHLPFVIAATMSLFSVVIYYFILKPR